MSKLLDAMRALLNFKQNSYEFLREYAKRFKSLRDILVLHIGGPIISTKFTQKLDNYDAKDADKIQAGVNKSWMQFLAVHLFG